MSVFLYHYRCDDNYVELKFCHIWDLSFFPFHPHKRCQYDNLPFNKLHWIVGADHKIPQLSLDSSTYSYYPGEDKVSRSEAKFKLQFWWYADVLWKLFCSPSMSDTSSGLSKLIHSQCFSSSCGHMQCHSSPLVPYFTAVYPDGQLIVYYLNGCSQTTHVSDWSS
jgi:hypothetical protein